MSTHRVYISSSTQSANVGVGQYGTEQDRMMQLSDRVKYWLDTQKKFTVFRNKPNWNLKQTVDDCNNLACEIFIDNHTNAGPAEQKAGDGGAEGTEVFYYHQGGMTCNSYKLASMLYSEVAPLSPGKDRGVLPDNAYVGSLYVIQNTNPPAALIEHIFHTNYEEVADMLAHMDKYAKAEAKAICKYFGEKWEEATIPEDNVSKLVADMVSDGIVTDKVYWANVLNGKEVPKPEYLQIAFRRATDKI
jgi:N-acetylmuramoyl-L-alanine amidase